ncbi:MAG: UvrD-helicase domain-containing protein, partial [Chloroflexi bacterium]|nr:UvrD-helicase domain-containing protein [Chloroflexota bacterium]
MTQVALADESVRERLRTELDATFFVEAGAGTGKTTALVTRVVELVARGHLPMERLAAITFTEAAAAELRDRLRQALEQSAVGRSSLEERSRCETASREVDLAAVQTIHAFAGSLLRTYPLEAGLPPNFTMLDELEQERSFDDRFRAWLYDDVPRDEFPERRAAVRRALTLGITAEQLRELAARLQDYRDLLNPSTLWPSPPVQEPVALAREWGGVLERLASEAVGEALDAEDKLAIELRRLRNIAEAMSAVDDAEEALRLLGQCSPRWNAGSQRNWPPGRCKAIKDVLHQCLDAVTTALSDHRSAAFADLLYQLRDFTLSFAADRKQAGTATFHDLLTWARDVLRDDAHVRRRAQDQFDRLFVDEFQDTDPLQVEIAWFLTSDPTQWHEHDWKKLRLVPGKLFIVGDPKQSIYRFRRADIGIYDEVYARLANPSDRAVLSQSFRSPAGLVDWFNHHFAWDMQRVAHVQPRYEPLDPRPDGSDASSTSCFQVSHFGDRIDSATERWQAEAESTARIAMQIVLGDTPWQVFDKAENSVRGAHFNDICVLIPTRTNLRGLERAFQRESVPFRMESGWLVLHTQEVRELLSCLRAIDDPSDQVALVAALRSPAYACSDVDLLHWVDASGRFDYGRPGQGCEGPVLNALVSLRTFHEARMRHTPAELTELFIRDRMLAAQAFGGSKPRDTLRRLRYVVAQARRLASNGPSTLRSLCDWLESRQREQYYDAESPVPDADEDAVRFMTVHGSKGLEFPIVILTGLGTATSRVGPQSVDLVPDYHADILNIRCGDFLTAGYDRATEKAMYEAEQKRLLYVATTRARDHLVLSVFRGKDACHATRIVERLLGHAELSAQRTIAPIAAEPAAASNSSPTRDGTTTDLTPEAHRAREEAFITERESLIARVANQTVIAPSRLAHAESAPDAETAEQPEPPPEPDPQTYVQRLPNGRGGSALGCAVHAVLQVIDLATLADLEQLATAAAQSEAIPDLQATVVEYVRNAASSAPVQRAISGRRYWREVPIGVTWNDADALLEGTIDLLFEQPGESLHLVDYKTDRVTEAQLLRRASEYRTQVQTYANALERVTGRSVAEVSLVFCSLNRVVTLTPGTDGAWTSIRLKGRPMQPGSKRWHVVTDSEHAHEREGLAYVRQVLPDRAPFQAWSNFEFVDANGIWSEVDLLVLGEESLHLVELKHYQGDIQGNAYFWQLAHRSEESPLEKAGKKARRLAGVLRSAARRLGFSDADVPFVKQSVFLHADTTRCLLPESDRAGLYGLDEREQQSNLPGISRLLLEPARRGPVNETRVLAIVGEAGFALRRQREVGSWRLIGPALDETESWQDWPAEHHVTREQARIRFFTTPRGAPRAQIASTRQLVEREFALTRRLRHPGILAPRDIVDDELGSGLVFPSEERDQRLELWLADRGTSLSLRAQVDLIRQLAEAVRYAHSNGVVHRGLNPTAVLVRPRADGGPQCLVGGWQMAGVLQGSRMPSTQGTATRIFGQLDEQHRGTRAQVNDAYVAPEGQWRPDADRSRLDLFA